MVCISSHQRQQLLHMQTSLLHSHSLLLLFLRSQLLAVFRFLCLQVGYAAFRLKHWCVIAVSHLPSLTRPLWRRLKLHMLWPKIVFSSAGDHTSHQRLPGHQGDWIQCEWLPLLNLPTHHALLYLRQTVLCNPFSASTSFLWDHFFFFSHSAVHELKLCKIGFLSCAALKSRAGVAYFRLHRSSSRMPLATCCPSPPSCWPGWRRGSLTSRFSRRRPMRSEVRAATAASNQSSDEMWY